MQISLLTQGACCTLLPLDQSLIAITHALQLIGDIVPLDDKRETALLFHIQLLLPRLFNGIGPRWNRVLSVSQSEASKTANVTLIMATSSTPESFQQASEVHCCPGARFGVDSKHPSDNRWLCL